MIQSIFIIQTGFKRDPNVIQTWSKRDSTWFKRDINVIQTRIVIQTLFNNNVNLIELSRGVSLVKIFLFYSFFVQYIFWKIEKWSNLSNLQKCLSSRICTKIGLIFTKIQALYLVSGNKSWIEADLLLSSKSNRPLFSARKGKEKRSEKKFWCCCPNSVCFLFPKAKEKVLPLLNISQIFQRSSNGNIG